MSDKGCQCPADYRASNSGRRSIVRVALSGVCFLGAVLLVDFAYRLALRPDLVGRELNHLCLAWAFVNVISFAVVGVGLFSRRQRLTVVGGCVLVPSTVLLLVAARWHW